MSEQFPLRDVASRFGLPSRGTGRTFRPGAGRGPQHGSGSAMMADELAASPESRRRFLRNVATSSTAAAALFGGLGFDPLVTAAMAQELSKSDKPLKAAFSHAPRQASWWARGREAAEVWVKLFTVEVPWSEGELSATKHGAAIDN